MPISEYDAAMARAATTSDVFNAIAEPQRREILVLLRAGERPVTELARELGITQPGASKHLRVLREVGLVRRPQGRQAAPVRPRRARAAAGPRVDRRVRAVLERELRPAGRLRAGPRAGTTGGEPMEHDVARSRDGRPRDRHLPGHRCPTGAGVRGLHRGPAPVAVVGTGGVHHHHAGVRVPRRRGVGLRDARTGRDGLPGVDLLDRDRPAGADRAASTASPAATRTPSSRS